MAYRHEILWIRWPPETDIDAGRLLSTQTVPALCGSSSGRGGELLEDGMEFSADRTVTDDGTVVVALEGSLDVATAPELRELLVHLIDEGRYRLVLEMSGVDFVDSIGLGVFVGVVHRLRPYDGSLVVAAPSAQTRKVFEITQLVRVVPLHDSVDAALSAVRGGRDGAADPA
jgi:anti-sigma B factor antagonist